MPLHFTLSGLAITLALLGSCRREAVDAAPETVVEAFIERMRGVHGDPERGLRALNLVWAEGRKAIEERAERATAAAGRTVRPEAMLAPSRFSLRFEPQRVSVETRGDWSRVTLFGASPSEVVEVPCVREDGAWRVVIDFPALPPIEWRD
jgi:hypothetical protein